MRDRDSGASILSDVTRGRLGHRYRIGVWDVDPRGCTLSCAGAVTKLAPRAMDVLVYLACRPGQTVSHAELLAAFWRGPNSSTNAVHKAVVELRRALATVGDQRRYIETVPKRGYRLVAAVSQVAPREQRTESFVRPSMRRLRWVITPGFLVATAYFMTLSREMGATVTKMDDGSLAFVSKDAAVASTRRSALDLAIEKVAGALKESHGVLNPEAWGASYFVQVDVSVDDRLRALLAIISDSSDDLSDREQFGVLDRQTLIDDLISHTTEDVRVMPDEEAVNHDA